MQDLSYVLYKPQYLASLIDFKDRMFKRSDTLKYFNFRFVNHPYIETIESPVLLVLRSEKIVAEFDYIPMKFSVNGAIHEGVWGVDWMVDEEERGRGIGKKIALYNLSVKNFFAFGTSPLSYSIQKDLGYYMLDSFFKLVYIPTIKSFLSLFFSSRNKTKLPFPEFIKADGNTFFLSSSPPEINSDHWNNDIIEPLRDDKFISWRFFSSYPDFKFYFNRNNKNPVYFVVKTLKWKNHQFLILVDFRAKLSDTVSVKSIIDSCKQLVKLTNSKGLITGSSIKNLVHKFRKYGFYCFESPSNILTSSDLGENYPFYKQKGIFLTMADSDFECVYKLKGKLHRRIIKGMLTDFLKFKFK